MVYIYKFKVWYGHCFKSTQILAVHVSRKVMNENKRVCLSACFHGDVRASGIGIKMAVGILIKFRIWIRCLLT